MKDPLPEVRLSYWFGAVLSMGSFMSMLFAASPGGVDVSFNPGSGNRGGFDSEVTSMAVQPDGQIVVAGAFTKVGTTVRMGLARLNPDGSLDASLDPGGGLVRLTETVLLEPDGEIVMGGWSGSYGGLALPYLSRATVDGSPVASFVPNPGDYLTDCLLQPDGRILLSGYFGEVGGVGRPYLARVMPGGALDFSFDPGVGPDSFVYTMALQPDGKIVIAGDFTSVNGVTRNRIARLHPDGSLDLSFDPGAGANKIVYDLELQPDGKVLVGGWFDQFGGSEQYFLGRLLDDGTPDGSFLPHIDPAIGQVLSVKVQPDGKVLAAGQFWTVEGVSRQCIARFMPDGVLDLDFDPGTGPVEDPKSGLLPMIREIALQQDGYVLAGGRFIEFDGVKLNRMVRLVGDQGGAVQWVQNSASIGSDATEAWIEVSRSGSSAGPVSVDIGVLSTSGAVRGVDFEFESPTVVFQQGEMTTSARVYIPPGGMTGNDAQVTLALGNPLGGILLGAAQTLNLSLTARSVVEVVPPEFTDVQFDAAGGGLTLSVDTTSPGDYTLQSSVDSTQWSDLQTLSGPGHLVFEVAPEQGGGVCFYRVRR
ncbi:MAG: hypothetical protein RI897_2014 [Verrucomicrobiota bacterium]|jgi:uncharacterized delta-60 repeat protein